eukprot:COSAG01_NODE_10065_length_2258_cov_2.805465_1_plen_135_part_00
MAAMLLLRLLLLALLAPPAVSSRTGIPDFGSKPHIVMVVVDDLVRSTVSSCERLTSIVSSCECLTAAPSSHAGLAQCWLAQQGHDYPQRGRPGEERHAVAPELHLLVLCTHKILHNGVSTARPHLLLQPLRSRA